MRIRSLVRTDLLGILGVCAALSLASCGEAGEDQGDGLGAGEGTGAAPAAGGSTSSGGSASGGSTSGGGSASGGAGSSSGGQAAAVDFREVATLVHTSCGAKVCHGQDEEPRLIDDGSLPDTLLGTVVEDCGNVPLVTPGNPDASALILLVERRCGALVMPDGCRRTPCLAPERIQVWADWITAGAPFD